MFLKALITNMTLEKQKKKMRYNLAFKMFFQKKVMGISILF